MAPRLLPILLVLALARPAAAQPLPLVEDDWGGLRAHVRDLLKHLDSAEAPLPVGATKAIGALLEQKKPDDPAAACQAVQKLLDAHCLIGVTINPESRVKAARGPRKATLTVGEAAHVLVKVHNDAGVTHALSVESDQRLIRGKQDDDRWLEMAIRNDRPFTSRLSGRKVEYRVMRLTARQSGKREATLAFDVGQGTQELGFLAEVPILFTVAKRK